jgi:RNA polymerase sigma factor (sigma-70 family)
MNKEQLFEEHMHLVRKTIYKMFPASRQIAARHRMELDDLLQYGYEGLWKACVNYKKGKSSFRTYAINYIRWHVMNGINYYGGLIHFQHKDRKEKIKEVKFYDLFERAYKEESKSKSTLLCEIIPNQNIDIEYEYISNERFKKAIGCLERKQRDILLAYLKGESQPEIAKRLGVTRQAVTFHYRNAKKKIKELLEDEWRKDKMIV